LSTTTTTTTTKRMPLISIALGIQFLGNQKACFFILIGTICPFIEKLN